MDLGLNGKTSAMTGGGGIALVIASVDGDYVVAQMLNVDSTDWMS